MLPNLNQQTIKEMLFSLGYNFKQTDKDLFELPFSYFKEKYDWLVAYKKGKADNLDSQVKSIPKIRSK